MDNVYTCSCGNQTFVIIETGVRCTACNLTFDVPHMSVRDFNHMVAEELEEEEV